MKKSISIVLLLAAALWIFNPSLAKHQTQIAESHGSGLGGALSRLVVQVGGLKYHDYLLFSTTTGADGKLVSVGLLGKVIVFQD